MTINKHYVEAKSKLRTGRVPDTFFTTKYGFSPYRACAHACAYCDGRAEKYYVEGDFETDIIIRENMPLLLAQQLPKLREPGPISISSGVSDPYQPVEEEECLMRSCAEVLAQHSHGAHLMTKSALALRDIDLWEKVHLKGGFTLMVSLVFLDDKNREIFEPGAATVEERLDLLAQYSSRGMDVAVAAMPFLPFINDSPEHLEKLFTRLEAIGVSHIIPGELTLRPGRQKAHFFEKIRDNYPKLLKDYERLFGEERPSGVSLKEYHRPFRRLIEKTLLRNKIPMASPHRVYQQRFALYDEVYILLSHMQQLYELRSIDIRPLKKALHNYHEWLNREKKRLFRKRSVDFTTLESSLRFMCQSGELASLLGNEKLARFLRSVIMDRAVFDYETLKLRTSGGKE